jgi:hypothetical protein
MLLPNVLMWVASGVAAGWKLSQLFRVPRDRDLRVVTACTVLVFLALSAQLVVTLPGLQSDLPAQAPKLVQNVFLTFFFALLLVLLRSSVSAAGVAARGYLELLLAALATAGLTLSFTLTQPASRGVSYEAANGDPSVLAFYLVGNFYMAYATARGTYLAWTAAAHTVSRARLSLRVAAAGLAVCCIGTHLPRVLYTAGQLTFGIDLIPNTELWTTPLLAVGIVTFFLGIGYPGVRTGLVKAILWVEMRREYRQLRPLWEAVCDAFPNIALFRRVHPLREFLQVRHMRLRYYRRIVECRDGLVCLSPYLEGPLDRTRTPEEQADLVRAVLKDGPGSSGAKRTSAAAILAAPAMAGMKADTRQLVMLSRALKD